MTLEEKKAKYKSLCHAMQTGVAFVMEKDPSGTSPKHLRVGINSAMVEHGALVSLMVKKGLITEDEYYDSLIEFMEREVQRYRDELEAIYGVKINIV